MRVQAEGQWARVKVLTSRKKFAVKRQYHQSTQKHHITLLIFHQKMKSVASFRMRVMVQAFGGAGKAKLGISTKTICREKLKHAVDSESSHYTTNLSSKLS